MKIGIYVGSFNPVHNGHIEIAKHILDKKYVDKIFIIPTGEYWHKTNLIDLQNRVNMLNLCKLNNMEVYDYLSKYKYTCEIFKYLESVSNDEYSLILGADNIEKFNEWKEYDYLLKHELIIYKRDNIDISKYLDKLNKKDKVIVINDVSNIDISSTEIRRSLEYLYKVIDYKTFKYIVNNNLYRSN